MSDPWDLWERRARRTIAAATLIGELIIFLYLLLIGFFPASLSVGSALVFLFVAAGVGERSLVSIPYSKSVPALELHVPMAASFELDSSGITIVRVQERYREPAPRCYRSPIEINKELLQGTAIQLDKIERLFESTKSIASLRNFSYQAALVRCANEPEIDSIKSVLDKFFPSNEPVSVDNSSCASDSKVVMLEPIFKDPSEHPVQTWLE